MTIRTSLRALAAAAVLIAPLAASDAKADWRLHVISYRMPLDTVACISSAAWMTFEFIS